MSFRGGGRGGFRGDRGGGGRGGGRGGFQSYGPPATVLGMRLQNPQKRALKLRERKVY